MQINREFVKKVVDTVGAGICSGLGKPVPGEMCVEAAVCYAMGDDHGDRPTCVDFELRDLLVEINDTVGWSSNKARADGMKRLSIAQLGTYGKPIAHLASKIAAKTGFKTVHPGQSARMLILDLREYLRNRRNPNCSRDDILSDFCEKVTEVLIEEGTPGTEFLDLAEELNANT